MVTAAVVYILVSLLLIVASALIFFKALQTMKQKNLTTRKEVSFANGGEASELKNRAEIVAKLERQFRSSPSADL
jgi:hypothetical protein